MVEPIQDGRYRTWKNTYRTVRNLVGKMFKFLLSDRYVYCPLAVSQGSVLIVLLGHKVKSSS